MVDPRPAPSVCVLAAAPFEQGGIERLTWDVHRSLSTTLGPGAVGLAALVGPADPSDGRAAGLRYAGPSGLSAASKARFAWWVVLSLARREPTTVLFCMHPNQAQVAMAARSMFGTRYVVWAHGAEVWGRMQRLPRAALRRASLVICSSEFTRRRVVETHGVHPARAVTVHPPVSAACLERAAAVRTTPGEAGPVILSAGRAGAGDAYKGFDTIVRTLPRLRDRVPDVRYVHVGGGGGLEDLRRLAESLGVHDHVELRGRVPDAELWDAFEASRVFAMPSRASAAGARPAHSGQAYGEGFGIVYVEAAAFGRPVVGSAAGGAAEAVADGVTGRAVDPADIEAVTAALLEYLAHPEAADRAGTAGRERVRAEFTPARFQERLSAAFERAGLPASSGVGSGP